MSQREPSIVGMVKRRATFFRADRAHTELIYGRNLTWNVNDERLERRIDAMLDQWRKVIVPPIGEDVRAAAFLLSIHERMPTAPLQVVGWHMPGVCAHHGSDGSFAHLSPDQREVTAVVSDVTDLDWAARAVVEPMWMGLFNKAPLYGLHAGAVCQNGRAVLFMGPHGAGKSSLVAGLTATGDCEYMSDDSVLVDGRTLIAYGRPWRIELRRRTWESLWDGSLPAAQHDHFEKRVWNGDELFDGRATASAPLDSLYFLSAGDRFDVRPLSPDGFRQALAKPIRFYEFENSRRGYEPVFDAISRQCRGYRLTISHELGIAECVARVRACLDSSGAGGP